MHRHCALATVEPQDYLIVEQLGAENIALISRHLFRTLFDASSEIQLNPARIARDRVKTRVMRKTNSTDGITLVVAKWSLRYL